MTLRRGLLLALLLAACAPVPPPTLPPDLPPAAPPTLPAPPPEPPPSPTPPPAPPPASVSDVLDRIAVGATLAEATAAVGRAPDEIVPAGSASDATARWKVEDGQGRWLVIAVLDASNRVTRKLSSPVEVPR